MLTGLVIIVAVTVATGFFVALEFAYVAVDRNRLRQLVDDEDNAAARRALRICERLSFALSGAQLGITVTALFVGFFAEPYLGEGLAELLGMTGLSDAASTALSVVIALVFANVVQMIIGELGPKNLAIALPEKMALLLSRPTQMYLAVAGPVITLFDNASNRMLRAIGIEPVEELPHGATAQDLHHIIDQSREGGHLDDELSAMLDRGLEFRELTAEQVMTPRVEVETLRADDTVAHAVAKLSTGHARFPVVGRDVDDLIGVVGIPEILSVDRADRDGVRLSAVAAPALLIPESLPAHEVLERMRAERRQMACVVDEFGGFAGIVSFEDVAEELVGEIHDEADTAEAVAVSRADGSWLVPGRWRIDQIGAETGIELPEDDAYETVSGLIMAALGRVAAPGDRLDLEAVDDGWIRLTVVSVGHHVPQAVELRPIPGEQAEPGVDETRPGDRT